MLPYGLTKHVGRGICYCVMCHGPNETSKELRKRARRCAKQQIQKEQHEHPSPS